MSSDEVGSKDLGAHDETSIVHDALYRPEVDTSHIDETKLMRKIDVRLVPWLALLYLLNFLDRGSIGNARLYGMETALGITDKQYLIALTVFFFPYSLFEPATNVLLRLMRPSWFLSGTIFFWGVVMTLHGVAHNYGGLLGLRFALGLAEAGLYPGIVFYLSCWYKKSELGKRVAWFFASATVAGAFSGLLAAGIHNMDGVGGKPGWAWIFILEGLATIIVACVSPLVLQDFPETAKFLTDAERVFVVRRLQADMQFSAGGEKFHLRHVWAALKDWKSWNAMVMYAGFDGPLFAFSLFLPTVLNQLGFGSTASNLLSVPVYAVACIVQCIVGFFGDRFNNRRGLINLILFGCGLVGYIILVASRNPSLSYFATYLAAIAWVSGNVEGSYKRSAVLGMAIGFGNLNGAVTSNVYRSRDKPWYSLGHGIVLVYIAIGFLSSLTYMIFLRRENLARDRGERDELIVPGGALDSTTSAERGAGGILVDEKSDRKSDSESDEYLKGKRNGVFGSVEEARREKGDLWSGFRYSL